MQSPWSALVRSLLRSPEGKELLRVVVAAIREELSANTDGCEWHDQRSSHCKASLGRNRWCRAVRERLERDPDDAHARIIGDRYLLDTQGLSEEMDRANQRPAPTVVKVVPAPDPDESPRLARVQHLLRRGG